MTTVCEEGCGPLHGELLRRGLVLSGAVIPLGLERLHLGALQLAGIRRATETLLRVLVRFGDAYPAEPRLRAALDLPRFEDELVRLAPGYPMHVQVGRFDAVLTPAGVRIVELNADTPGAMGYADVAHDVLESLRPAGTQGRTALLPRIVAALLAAHRASRPRAPKPRIAVVDATTAAWHDVQLGVDALARAGLEVVRVRPEGLHYDGSRLWAGGMAIELVWRRILLEDLIGEALIAAARDGRVVVVNAFRARVANNKKLLALIADPAFGHLITKDERQVLDHAVPCTRILLPELAEECAAARERLVIKPAVGYAGAGVHIGVEVGQAAWERVIADVAPAGSHVVQDYVPSPELDVPVLEHGLVRERRARVSVSPFLVDGHYAGTVARLADRPLVNLSHGGALLSCVEAPLA